MYDYDFFEFDPNGDGYPDTFVETFDTSGDGNVDAMIMASDTNGDGYAETYVEMYDTNGDGNFNEMTAIADTNGDGYAETLLNAVDSNNSGEFDAAIAQIDTNGDGEFEVLQKSHDYNQDGQIDSITTYYDSDQDGQFDVVAKTYDSTGDGQMDQMDFFVDENGTGQADFHETYSYDPSTGQLIPAMAAGLEFGGTMYTELENFQPNEDYPEGVSGDPAEAMTHWEFQGDTNRCALYSQMFVIEELTGQDLNMEEFVQIAKDNGWFTEEGGTTYLNTNQMLDYYGVENEMQFHRSIEDIEECLNNDGRVIVSIDADETWYGKDNNIFSPETGANHAVEVIGIDRTDPENPMVVLNDSGTPNGRGEMIPLDVFEGAWGAGDSQMIACYPS